MNSFSHFGQEHIITLAVILLLIAVGLIISSKLSEKNAQILIRILSVTVLLGEALQDILLVRDGGNIMEFLPLHLCNLGIFVNLAASFTKGRVSSFFMEISVILIMPGAIGALLFPDWNYRPFWSYLPILCFLTHALLVFIPLFFLVRKKARITFRHFFYPYLFLLIVTPPIYLLDRKMDLDYMYLIYPPAKTPLEWIWNLSDGKLYIAGLAVLVTLILLLEYSVYGIFGRISGRK